MNYFFENENTAGNYSPAVKNKKTKKSDEDAENIYVCEKCGKKCSQVFNPTMIGAICSTCYLEII